MARPELIAKIHELKYELRRAGLTPGEFPKLQRDYDSAVNEACDQYRCSKAELLRTLASDFGKWVREAGLPWQYEIEDRPSEQTLS